jgi:hypothetical protein
MGPRPLVEIIVLDAVFDLEAFEKQCRRAGMTWAEWFRSREMGGSE